MDVFFNIMGTLIGLSFFLIYYFFRRNKVQL
jgi:glycopeptide antibiotics resistance protein